jgi:hypothetical protein
MNGLTFDWLLVWNCPPSSGHRVSEEKWRIVEVIDTHNHEVSYVMNGPPFARRLKEIHKTKVREFALFSNLVLVNSFRSSRRGMTVHNVAKFVIVSINHLHYFSISQILDGVVFAWFRLLSHGSADRNHHDHIQSILLHPLSEQSLLPPQG